MLWDTRKPHVLTAVSPRAAKRMSRILQGFVVQRAYSATDVARALRCWSFDVVIVGSRFDGPNAIEAVKLVLGRTPGVPLVCVHLERFCPAAEQATLAAFRAACEELGVDFVDVLSFPDDEAGNARVRAELESILLLHS